MLAQGVQIPVFLSFPFHFSFSGLLKKNNVEIDSQSIYFEKTQI
jgi:hypothetical protein